MMKTSIIFILFIACSFYSQADGLPKITVSVFKSTFIYFDDQVVSLDLGMNESYDATFEKNFVKITAVKQMADYQTNLTVTTRSGLYAFLVDYKDVPEKLYYFPEDFQALRRFASTPDAADKTATGKTNTIANPGFAGNDQGDSQLKSNCENLDKRQMDFPVAAFLCAKIDFSMDKIYVSGEKFYIKVVAQNKSNIDFNIDFVKFQIKNKRKIKRSSQQEIYMEPIFVYNKFDKLKGNSSNQMIFVLDKFTILKNKQLVLEIEENGGERNMSFVVPTNEILNATQL